MRACPVCHAPEGKPCREVWFPGEVIPHASRTESPSDGRVPNAEGSTPITTSGSVRAGERILYCVIPGDSPMKIAQKCSWPPGEPRAWRKLILANPLKKLEPGGLSFQQLKVGEWLILPEGWKAPSSPSSSSLDSEPSTP